jgi:ADP-ribose pyrophosphatase YjhB (NUDIX family)
MNQRSRQHNSVGVLFCAKDTHRHLFLLRNDRFPVWGLPGGKVERNETLREALERECREEIGQWPENSKLFPIEQFTAKENKFVYHTFYCFVEHEFIPVLNNEHIAYAWCDYLVKPQPLHSGLFNTLNYNLIVQKIQIIHEAVKP